MFLVFLVLISRHRQQYLPAYLIAGGRCILYSILVKTLAFVHAFLAYAPIDFAGYKKAEQPMSSVFRF